MFKLKQSIQVNKGLKKAIFVFFALAIIILPIVAFSSQKSDLYVNAKASGEQNGSKTHPYKTINQALDEADGKVEIHVAKGEYKENITLKKGVKLLGENKNNTIIKAKKDKWATVFIKNDAEINNFTIKDGKRGIWVKKDAEATITNCFIKNNKEEGIYIEANNTKESNQVVISKNKIKGNDYRGIRSVGARKISITESEIIENKSDGIDLARETKAWIAQNSIRGNKGSGMKLVLDQSNIWTSKNDIRENSREGIEVASFGTEGRIDIAKTKIVKNGLFGIARLQRAGTADWNKFFTASNQTEIWENRSGNISHIIYIK